MRKRIIALIIGGAIAALIIFGIRFFDSSSAAAVQKAPTGPVHLYGQWHQVHSGMSNVKMTATITENTITINMSMGDIQSVYWIGTFPVFDNVPNSFAVTSRGDTNAMSSDILASQDATKTFTYKDGELSYPFSIEGLNTTVYLSQGA